MKRLLAILTLAATLFPLGCHNDQPRPREIIILPDLSASIDKQSQQQMFAAIKDASLHLHRGDSLTVIPIMSDAEADLQGQILRYEVPPIEKREAYDADLRRLSAQVANDLSRLSTEAAASPGAHTDILGSVRVALRTFSTEPTDKRLIILSDFIQDDTQFNFKNDTRLANATTAEMLTRDVAVQTGSHQAVAIFLGRLKGKEFSSLRLQRRQAIDSFWEQLFCPSRINVDGPSGLLRFLEN
jgi:hypothetical protein